MIIGFDYWQVLSHYPELLTKLILRIDSMPDTEIHVISAIGKTRIGTIKGEVFKTINKAGYMNPHKVVHPDNIHEVVFDSPKESPELKLAKCKELGIEMFFDDRDDVCRLLNANGIMAMRVTRKDNSTYDLDAERK
jgi:acid phosphatase class B